LFIDNKILARDWTEHDLTSRSSVIYLEKGKLYNYKLEFFHSCGRPQLFVKWQLLNTDHFKNAVNLAKNSDVVIFVGGITSELEGEEMRVDYDGFKGGDRTNLKLPQVQENLLQAIHSTGTPVILVLTSGSALAVNWEKDNISAILQLWYPGQEGGTALADVLFGDYNPGGRLPITFYKSVDQLPPFEDYNMKGRTYRYFEDEPLFPFGHGLSYTKFEYRNLTVLDELTTGDDVTISVEVSNIGQMAGDEVVQLYVKKPQTSAPATIRSLQGFKRIHLQPGQKQVIEFTIKPKQLAIVNNNAKYTVETGNYRFSVGGMQPGTESATTEYLIKDVQITGESLLFN
jgi:beta-glucosidase